MHLKKPESLRHKRPPLRASILPGGTGTSGNGCSQNKTLKRSKIVITVLSWPLLRVECTPALNNKSHHGVHVSVQELSAHVCVPTVSSCRARVLS